MFESFKTWEDLLAYLDARSNIAHYQAPLELHRGPLAPRSLPSETVREARAKNGARGLTGTRRAGGNSWCALL
jgi:hypothetical protein